MGIRLAPMVIVAVTRTYSVLLPEIMESFSMSPSGGGRFVATIEGGSFCSLLILGFIIERIGARRVVLLGLPTVAVSLFVMTSIENLLLLSPVLVLVGSGMAWTATGINTLMAATGSRRSFYLGIMHSIFSAFALVAPIVAGWVLISHSWRTFYIGVGVLAIGLAILFWVCEVALRKSSEACTQPVKAAQGAQKRGPSIATIGLICLGVISLSGIQGAFNTWSYLYVKEMYEVSREFAVLAPTCLWGGLLLGRTALIGLARIFSARTLLISSSLLPAAAMSGERLLSSPSVALLAMFLVGLGISGAYQLGTQWAAERLPHRIGTASTAIMACGWLGNALWPWATGELIERTSYACLFGVVLCGCVVALLSFGLTRDRTAPATPTP